MSPIIITADDFGFSEEINEAVERAHRDGVLSAASLMISAPAAADAIARAQRLPTLRVGLHVVLVHGTPTLPREEVDALVDRDGRFPENLAAAGVKWFFSPRARRQLNREISAQFDAFRATGLELDHVNAHNHIHLHPTVLSAFLRELEGQKKAAVRLPREPWRSYKEKNDSPLRIGQLIERGIMSPWLRIMESRLRAAGVAHNDWILGLAESGHVDETALVRFIDTLPNGVIEVYCHPATHRTDTLERVMSDYDNESELAALVSPKVKARLYEKGLTPCGFAEIA